MNFFIILFYVLADQITKQVALIKLKGQPSVILIKDFLYFSYVENRGAAFGIFQNMRAVFVILTVIVFAAIIIMNKKNNYNFFTRTALGLISGGAAGNFLDRVKQSYVIDFIDIKFGNYYDFPVFNLADIFIVTGTALLMVLIMMNNIEEVSEDAQRTNQL